MHSAYGDRALRVEGRLMASRQTGIMKMNTESILQTQLGFYRNNKAGCSFAALAARQPEKYGWQQRVLDLDAEAIDEAIVLAVNAPQTTTLSLIFPEIVEPSDLLRFIDLLSTCRSVVLDQSVSYMQMRCLGFRAKIGGLFSWITGFGNYNFLPATRRSPFTEIAFRVKARPNYKQVMKKAPKNVIHLADLDMLGIADAVFKTLWRASIDRTTRLLGHPADLRSAAKTTFAIPEEMLELANA